jgi:aldose 1-epimerase
VTKPVEISSGALRASLRPDLGGCMEGLWFQDVPVLRSSAAGALADVRLSASYPLVPYSNRIANAQLVWDATPYPLAKNFDPEVHAIHGAGWQKPWQVQRAESSFVSMRLAHQSDASWPFAFEATQTFRVQDNALEATLDITNTSRFAAPVGLGWHPYFTKRADTHVQFVASALWEMGADKLPTHSVASTGLNRDCAGLKIDNCFDGWSGTTVLRDAQLTTRLESDLRRLVVFTEPQRDFIAIEPVSHVNNAMNQADQHQALGVVVLAAGQSWRASMRIHTRRTAP